MTNWLTKTEQSAWRTYLQATRALETHLDAELQAEHQLSLTEYVVLAMLSEARDRTMRLNELAELSLLSRSHLSHRIKPLIDRGFVLRIVCKVDRRGAYAKLTSSGLKKVEKAAPCHVRGVRQWMIEPFGSNQFIRASAGFARAYASMSKAEV